MPDIRSYSQDNKFRKKAHFSWNLYGVFYNKNKKGGQRTRNISHAQKKAMKPLKKELKAYRDNGIALYLNGIPSKPKTIAKACVAAEGCGYMRDYTEDEKGRIAKVSFDFVEIN